MTVHAADPDRALQLAREWDRAQCALSPARFANLHVEIEDPDGTVVPFALWGFQRETMRALHDHQLVIVLKARRLGLSWLVLSYALWLAIFQPGSRIVMLCKRLDDAKEMVARIQRMSRRLGTSCRSAHLLDRHPVKREATDRFDLGESVFRALPATPAAARSETAALWVWDEAAFVDDGPAIMQGALPTIEGGGRAVIVSTGNGELGQGQEFAQQYRRAQAGESPWLALFWPWQCRPGRDDAWKAEMIGQLGAEERFRTEYPATVEDALHRPGALLVFDEELLLSAQRMSHPAIKSLRLGVDVAREGRDYSTIYSFQHGRVRRVARGHWPDLMQTVGHVRRAALELEAQSVIVDATGLGAGVVDRLREVEPKLDVIGYLAGGRAYDQTRYVNRRAETLWELREAMRDGLIDLDPHDTPLIQELRSIAWYTDSLGRIAIESKDKLRARGLPSPDHADAASYAALGLGRLGLTEPQPRRNGHTKAITGGLMTRPL